MPVWGPEYTQLFLDVAIPAQLAEGNLPAFHGDPQSKYIIYTTSVDAETIRSSPTFRQLTGIIPTVIECMDEAINAPKAVHDKASECFRRGISAADEIGAAIIFLCPDLVFADGSFATLKERAQAGWDVVGTTGIRTRKHAVSFHLRTQYQIGSAIKIMPRDLMRIALEDLHPLADLSWWDEGHSDLLPANLYWRAGSDGIVARCFHLHPLLVLPQKKNAAFFQSADGDYVMAACPDSTRDYVVTDSDEILMIELSDENRNIATAMRKGSVADAALFAEQSANCRHRSLFGFTIRMHTDSATTKRGKRRKRCRHGCNCYQQAAPPSGVASVFDTRSSPLGTSDSSEKGSTTCVRKRSLAFRRKFDCLTKLVRRRYAAELVHDPSGINAVVAAREGRAYR